MYRSHVAAMRYEARSYRIEDIRWDVWMRLSRVRPQLG